MNQWWTSTLQSVREKSLDAIEFVRKDLVDFTDTVKNDTENYLKKIQKQPVRIGDFGINRIVSRFNHTKTSNNDHENHPLPSASFDRVQNERLRLENDESTYLTDPDPIEVYQTWRESSDFNIDERKGEISQLLIDAPHIRSIYARSVPACTTHVDFWARYYFRLHQLNEEETKRINLLKRAEEICNETHENDWEDPDEEWIKDDSHLHRPPPTTIVTITNNRRESDAGDSWDHQFDEQAIPKPQTTDRELPKENSAISVNPSADNDFEDDWE